MVYEPAVREDPEHIFPKEPLVVTMKLGSMEHYTNKIANYSFAATIIVSWAFSVLMVQIKTMQQNHVLCQSTSLLSVSLNIIWSLLFFSMHFQYSL
jgi:hypothetical protein